MNKKPRESGAKEIEMNSSTNSIFLLPLASIRIDCGIQQREEMLDAGVVSEYARAMLDGSQFPPVVVFHDGATHWLADGFHRVEAADEADQKTIAAEIRQGSKRDAILYAVSANRDHGLRRSRADVRRAITTLLTDDEWRSWADRAIADMVGCSPTTVGTVRDQLSNLDSSNLGQDAQEPEGQVSKLDTWDDPPLDIEDQRTETHEPKASLPPTKRIGRDGKAYPATKDKPAPKPAPAVNKAVVAMQAAHMVAAALTRMEALEVDLSADDARMVMNNLRAVLARLEDRFGMEGMGHA